MGRLGLDRVLDLDLRNDRPGDLVDRAQLAPVIVQPGMRSGQNEPGHDDGVPRIDDRPSAGNRTVGGHPLDLAFVDQ